MAEKMAELLTPKQRRAINALMESRTNTDAAKAAAISERQLYRWLNDPIFKAELIKTESQAADMTSRRLTFGTKYALEVILFIMSSRDAPYSLRLSAARTWLDNYLKTRDQADLDARITALEARQYED